MKKYICDCGREFTDPDGPIMCADNNHGQGCRECAALRQKLKEKETECKRCEEAINKIHEIVTDVYLKNIGHGAGIEKIENI